MLTRTWSSVRTPDPPPAGTRRLLGNPPRGCRLGNSASPIGRRVAEGSSPGCPLQAGGEPDHPEPPSNKQTPPLGGVCAFVVNSGGRIRTCDLRVMSPTSYLAAPPRNRAPSITRGSKHCQHLHRGRMGGAVATGLERQAIRDGCCNLRGRHPVPTPGASPTQAALGGAGERGPAWRTKISTAVHVMGCIGSGPEALCRAVPAGGGGVGAAGMARPREGVVGGWARSAGWGGPGWADASGPHPWGWLLGGGGTPGRGRAEGSG